MNDLTHPSLSAPALVDPADYAAVQQLYAHYAAVLDRGDWELWPEFFTEECIYKVQPRENHDQGLPLATLSFESQGMLRDRAYGVRETLFHDPYYQRHVFGPPLVHADGEGRWRCEVNYAVFRTKRDQATEAYNVGRSLDLVERTPQGLRFRERICVFDSEMIPNSLIYPI